MVAPLISLWDDYIVRGSINILFVIYTKDGIATLLITHPTNPADEANMPVRKQGHKHRS